MKGSASEPLLSKSRNASAPRIDEIPYKICKKCSNYVYIFLKILNLVINGKYHFNGKVPRKFTFQRCKHLDNSILIFLPYSPI